MCVCVCVCACVRACVSMSVYVSVTCRYCIETAAQIELRVFAYRCPATFATLYFMEVRLSPKIRFQICTSKFSPTVEFCVAHPPLPRAPQTVGTPGSDGRHGKSCPHRPMIVACWSHKASNCVYSTMIS